MTDERFFEIFYGKVDVVDLSFEEQQDYYAKQRSLNNRISTEELEKEFEDKSNFLLNTEWFEFSDLSLEDFINIIFTRPDRKDMEEFEERDSREYQIWNKQREKIKRKQRKEAERSGALPPSSSLTTDPSLNMDYSEYREWRYNPVVYYKEPGKDGKIKNRHWVVLKEYQEDGTIEFLKNRQFAIMSPATYVGRKNTLKNSRRLFAFAIDLDGVGIQNLEVLLKNMAKENFPVANIIVNSGHGVHVYYLLEDPLDMYDNKIKILKNLKKGLTKLLWTVTPEKTQYQAVTQGFRIPGSKTKFGGSVRAFYNSQAPYHTPEELNGFVGKNKYKLTADEVRSITNPYKYNPKRVKLETAKELWPEWYEARIVQKKSVVKPWKVKRAAYDKYLEILREGKEVSVGHRYWCIMCLVAFATKCNIPKEEVENDALNLIPKFDLLTKTADNRFTKEDVETALSAYGSEKLHKWKVEYMEERTDVKIKTKETKRNDPPFPREFILEEARRRRDKRCQMKGMERWDQFNGRKKGSVVTADKSNKAKIIKEWKEVNPECENKSKCARELGISRTTVRKWDWSNHDSNPGRKKETAETSAEAALIIQWQIANPNCNNKARCARETGMSRTTVHKWWT